MFIKFQKILKEKKQKRDTKNIKTYAIQEHNTAIKLRRIFILFSRNFFFLTKKQENFAKTKKFKKFPIYKL